MAITVSFPAANIVTDLTAVTITATDASTYTSPTRTGVGVFVKLYKMDYTGNRTALTTTPNNSDPASASTTSWSALYTADGWHQLVYVAAPAYSAGTTYAQYDVVYDSSTKGLYQSQQAGNIGNLLTNATYWTAVPDPLTVALAIGTSQQAANLVALTSTAILNFGVKAALAVAFGDQTGNAFLEMTSDYKRSQDVRVYELLGLALDAIKVADSRQNYSALEIYARRAASIIALA